MLYTEETLDLIAEYQRKLRVERARGSFLSFVKTVWPAFMEGRHHKIMAEKLQQVAEGKLKRLIINMPPRHCLELSTPIPTTSGWKTMADIRVGDFVFGPDGLPTRVVGKSEVHRDRLLWRVSTDDGAEVVTDEGHLWTVRLCRKRPVFRTKTTAELALRQMDRVHKESRKPMLPDWEPVQYPPADLPVHPYMLGVWLGDGHSGQAIITSHDDDQPHVRGRIEQYCGLTTTDQVTKFTFGVLDLKVKLRELGVLGNKHIPRQYLTASREQRIELLRGLMDTDGNVSKAAQCFYSTSSAALRDGVVELIRSLGMKASVTVCRAKLNGKDYGEHYRVSFYGVGVATLPRKADRCRGHIKPTGRYLSFEPAGRGDVQCIQVEREDGLFLAGRGYMVTHNTKSEFASYHFPAYLLGRNPKLKIIQATHTAELAEHFGRKTRNLIASPEYQEIFPGVTLRSDSKAAGRWQTAQGAEYFAVGVGGAMTGRGADVLIIDDPHSEQDLSDGAFESCWEWYTSGPRQRLQPGGAIILVMTRWSKKDLTQHLLDQQVKDDKADRWEVIEFPAILPSGNPLWPEWFSLQELEAIKASNYSKWRGQWLQQPVAEEGNIIQSGWWQTWEKNDPPDCEHIIQSWDTAFEKGKRNDYTVCTTWGVFRIDEQPNVILLDVFRERIDFPSLKERALKLYQYWEPDVVIIEAKASGTPLTQELRQIGVPVVNFIPSRGNDKEVRAHSVAPLVEAGVVWVPDRAWAKELVEECADFPSGSHDDLVDSTTQALLRFRQGGFIRLGSDYEDDELPQRKRKYY